MQQHVDVSFTYFSVCFKCHLIATIIINTVTNILKPIDSDEYIPHTQMGE